MIRRAALLALAALVLPLVAVVCGLGWLYVLRSGHLLASGPRVKGALALEQLSLGDAQPLVRTLAAWIAAGLAAGALLRAFAGTRAVRLLAPFAVGSAACLVMAGAVSDALVNNARVADQLAAQLSSPGPAVALSAVVVAALGGQLAAAGVARA